MHQKIPGFRIGTEMAENICVFYYQKSLDNLPIM